jgi:hypothetical protein
MASNHAEQQPFTLQVEYSDEIFVLPWLAVSNRPFMTAEDQADGFYLHVDNFLLIEAA